MNRLWPRPSTRISRSRAGPDREVAGERRRVVPREDVEAGDGQGVRQRLAGQRAAEHGPVADAHGANTTRATTAGDADRAATRAARSRPPARARRATTQVRPSQTASLRVSAAEPDEHAEADQPRVGQRARRAGRAAIRVISRQAASASTVNGIVESGSAEWSRSGR